jgi:protocatechuate 3,4-dioxygenase beta subunit
MALIQRDDTQSDAGLPDLRLTSDEGIRNEDRVLDGPNAPHGAVLLELCQAKAAGRYIPPADRPTDKPFDLEFRSSGRTETGLNRFDTINPGACRRVATTRRCNPHVNIWLAARHIFIGVTLPHVFRER